MEKVSIVAETFCHGSHMDIGWEQLTRGTVAVVHFQVEQTDKE